MYFLNLGVKGLKERETLFREICRLWGGGGGLMSARYVLNYCSMVPHSHLLPFCSGETVQTSCPE